MILLITPACSPSRGRREHGAFRPGWHGFRPCRSPASSTRARWRLLCCAGEGAAERTARVFRCGCDARLRARPLVRRAAPGASPSRRRVITGRRTRAISAERGAAACRLCVHSVCGAETGTGVHANFFSLSKKSPVFLLFRSWVAPAAPCQHAPACCPAGTAGRAFFRLSLNAASLVAGSTLRPCILSSPIRSQSDHANQYCSKRPLILQRSLQLSHIVTV
jgi:hypothetical protein